MAAFNARMGDIIQREAGREAVRKQLVQQVWQHPLGKSVVLLSGLISAIWIIGLSTLHPTLLFSWRSFRRHLLRRPRGERKVMHR